MIGSVNWDKLNGFQLKLLWEALTSDFNADTLDQTLTFQLSRKSLANYVATTANFDTQVFQLIRLTQMQGWTRQLVDAGLRTNPNSPGLRIFFETIGLTAGATMQAPAGWKLEDLLRPEVGFLKPDGWLYRLAALRRQVCRIEHPSRPSERPGFGTGWLVGADLMLTNHHVICPFLGHKDFDAAEIICRFDVPEAPGSAAGRSSKLANDWLVVADQALDFALVRLSERVGDDQVGERRRGQVHLDERASFPAFGDVLLIVQHPDGMPQRFAFGNVKSISVDRRRLLHDANTMKGSSGSPIVDIKLNIMALHRSGGLDNQAVPIEMIIEHDLFKTNLAAGSSLH